MAYTATKNWKAGSSMISTDFDTYVSANMDVANQQLLTFTATGAIANATTVPSSSLARWIAPYALTVNSVWLSAGAASTTGSLIMDVLRSTNSTAAAVTLFTSSSELPTLSSGKTETTAGTTPDVTSVSAGHVLTVALTTSSGSTAVSDVQLLISLSGA